MDNLSFLVGASVIGNLAHIAKKGVFHNEDSFWIVVERYLFSKVHYTLGAIVAGIVAAGTVTVTEGASWVEVFSQGFMAGYVADSLINRAEQLKEGG